MRTLFFVLQLFNAAASTFNLMVCRIVCHGLWCFPVLLALGCGLKLWVFVCVQSLR